MKRNLDAPILQLDGKSFQDKATLKTIAFIAVTTPINSDQSLPAAEKINLYKLAQKIHLGGIVDFSAEEISLLKDRIPKIFANVIVVGRAYELLESDYTEPSAAEIQARFDESVDAHDQPSGATKQPDQFGGS